jgi:hypothetical protein
MMNLATRTLIAACAVLAFSLAATAAQAHGRRGGGHWGPGAFVGGVGIGIGVGVGLGGHYSYRPGYYHYPGYVIVDSPPVYYRSEARPVPAVPSEPAAKAAPDPIFYPRNGQSEAQTEADRVECNRWAATQPTAMADASVFQRASHACMEGRGYVVR